MRKVIVLNEGEEIFNIKGMSDAEKCVLIKLIQRCYKNSTEEEIMNNKVVKIPFDRDNEEHMESLSAMEFLMDITLELVDSNQKYRSKCRLASGMYTETRKKRIKDGMMELDIFNQREHEGKEIKKKTKLGYLCIEWSKAGILGLLWRACLIENIKEYVAISDKYGQRMYLMILGEDKASYLKYDKMKFWSNLDIPLSYLKNTGKIKQTVLREALLELTKIFGYVDIESERNSVEVGRPVLGYSLMIGAEENA